MLTCDSDHDSVTNTQSGEIIKVIIAIKSVKLMQISLCFCNGF